MARKTKIHEQVDQMAREHHRCDVRLATPVVEEIDQSIGKPDLPDRSAILQDAVALWGFWRQQWSRIDEDGPVVHPIFGVIPEPKRRSMSVDERRGGLRYFKCSS